jgi:hypothetical protein
MHNLALGVSPWGLDATRGRLISADENFDLASTPKKDFANTSKLGSDVKS